RRRRIWRHLNQVETPVPRHLERLKRRDDPDLLSLFIDQADFANPNAFVYASLDGSRNSMLRFSLVGSFVFTQPICQAALARGRASLPANNKRLETLDNDHEVPSTKKHRRPTTGVSAPWLEGNGSMSPGHRS